MELQINYSDKEILIWTVEGKTSEEIGQILGVSKRTIDYHILNTINKTKSRNKIQIVIKIILFEHILVFIPFPPSTKMVTHHVIQAPTSAS
jgi:DNA-binding CsgD family transcriptional regulator